MHSVLRNKKCRKAIAKGLLALSSAAGLIAATHSAEASTFYWDGDGAGALGNPPTTFVGGAGSWENSTLRWWDGTTYQSWTAAGGQDVADFRGTAGIVTVGTSGNPV